MKLLSLHIKSGNLSGGILEGLHIRFHGPESVAGLLEPVCFVGLNGSGKSQVLQAVAEIFYYMDRCFRDFNPDTAATDLLFEIEYLIQRGTDTHHVRCEHLSVKKGPGVHVIHNGHAQEVSDEKEIVALLPRRVIGYTSGDNETLSVPFLDTYQDYAKFVTELALPSRKTNYTHVPDPRLVMMDYSDNIAILVANFLRRPMKDLTVFEDEIKVLGLESFRLIVQLKHKTVGGKKEVLLTRQHKTDLEKWVKCATCFDYQKDAERWVLDFLVNAETRNAFRHHFTSAFDLYSAFNRFALLNNLMIKKEHRTNIEKQRKKQGTVVKLPTVAEEDRVFRFQGVKLNLVGGTGPVDYIALSDGEHQFVQIFGTVLMVDGDNDLFLLDEPESHFNPKWRIRFVPVLEEIAKGRKQDFLITSHSPFLLSDTPRERVFVFEKKSGRVTVRNPDAQTYGTTFDALLKEAFGVEPPISDKSKDAIRQLQKSGTLEELEKGVEEFGDSTEKFYLFQRIEELKAAKRTK
jgi:restriction system-associated AAA family ATPase